MKRAISHTSNQEEQEPYSIPFPVSPIRDAAEPPLRKVRRRLFVEEVKKAGVEKTEKSEETKEQKKQKEIVPALLPLVPVLVPEEEKEAKWDTHSPKRTFADYIKYLEDRGTPTHAPTYDDWASLSPSTPTSYGVAHQDSLSLS